MAFWLPAMAIMGAISKYEDNQRKQNIEDASRSSRSDQQRYNWARRNPMNPDEIRYNDGAGPIGSAIQGGVGGAMQGMEFDKGPNQNDTLFSKSQGPDYESMREKTGGGGIFDNPFERRKPAIR